VGFLQFLQGVERQFNVVDNNKTFKNAKGNGNKAAVTQVKDLGWSFLKNNIVKPAQEVAHSPVGEAVRTGVAAVTRNPEAQANASHELSVDLKSLVTTKDPHLTTTDNQGKVSVNTPATAAVLGATAAAGHTAPELGNLDHGIQQLAKAKTTAEVRNVMKGTPPEVVDKLAPALAKTSDPHTIRNILNQHIQPPPSMVPSKGSIAPEHNRPAFEIDKNPHFQQLAEEARKAKSFEEFANKTYDVPIKHVHGNTPEAANTPGVSRTPNDPVEIYMRQGRPVIDITDGNHRLYAAKARGDETIKAKFNDSTKEGAGHWGRLKDFYDEANAQPTQVTPSLREATVPQGEVIPPRDNPMQSVVQALRGQPAAEGQSPVTGLAALQQRQKELYSAERGARLTKGTAASQDLTGREAMQAQFSAQKGELPRVNSTALIDHLRSKVTPSDVQDILTAIQKSPHLTDFERLPGQKAITNLFDEGKLPRPSESKILEKVAPGFNDALGSAAQESLTKGQKVKNFAVELAGAPRSILAVDPSSAWLRQGAVLGSRFPKEFFKSAGASIKYLGSEKKYQAMLEEVNSRPTADIHDTWGIAKTAAGGTKREEPFQSTLAERIPIAGRVVRAADRGYTGFLTKLRADSTDHIIGNLEDAGIDPRTEISAKAGKDIGRFINTSSGRGNLGAFEKDAATLSKALFSPRLWKSRLDLLNPVYYAKLDPIARKYALQSAGSFAAIAGTVLGLASLAGAHVETDARSSDFLKIKVGNTRYDILGGLQQNLVLAHREIKGEKKSSQSGRITDLNSGDFGAANRLSVLSDFVQNKENPVVSTGAKILKGTDQTGQKVNPAVEIGKLGVPLGITDTYQAVKDTGSLSKGILKASPTNVGIGVGTYGTKDIAISKNQTKYVNSIKDKTQQSATKLLLQTLKTAPVKDDVKDEIQAAMQKGDTKKVIKLAQDFNKKYDATSDDWFKTNEKYYNKDDNLKKVYRKGYITETTLDRWDAALKKAKKGPSL
jgi:hypothetical protein